MQFKKFFAVSAFAGIALGANNSTLTSATPSVGKSCSFSDFTATNSQGVASVAACSTAVGDITIEGGGLANINLNGIQQLYGSLKVQNATQATSLDAPTLQLVSESLELVENTRLSNLNLAQLATVGSLTFDALPELEKAGLTSGITTADTVDISNTGLTSLEGINVYKLKNFNVANNEQIETIDSGLETVTGQLSVAYNADKVDLSFDKLKKANTISLQQFSSFSAPNLTTVDGSVFLISSSADKIELEQLKSVGNSFVINKNDDLEEIDFPKLGNIGGALQISDNDKLETLEGFDKLESVGGSLIVNGSFNNGTFKSLQKVSGALNFKTDGDLSCKAFDKFKKEGDVKGKFSCSTNFKEKSKSKSKSNSKSGSSSSSSSSSSGSSGSKSGDSSSSSSKKSGATSTSVKLVTVVAGLLGVGVSLY